MWYLSFIIIRTINKQKLCNVLTGAIIAVFVFLKNTIKRLKIPRTKGYKKQGRFVFPFGRK